MAHPLHRITFEPRQCHGKPTLRGMRYAVEDVLTWLRAGMTHEQILQDYPDLVLEDILASLAYAAAGTTCSRSRRRG